MQIKVDYKTRWKATSAGIVQKREDKGKKVH